MNTQLMKVATVAEVSQKVSQAMDLLSQGKTTSVATIARKQRGANLYTSDTLGYCYRKKLRHLRHFDDVTDSIGERPATVPATVLRHLRQFLALVHPLSLSPYKERELFIYLYITRTCSSLRLICL